MKFLVIYSIINLFGIIYCDDVKLQKSVGMTLNHPDQTGYHASVLGTEKHKYGYEIKHQNSGKHFHHTSTEKDGVRLGCYGFEVDGKKYLTQYIADVKGYRLVTNEDLVTVYPKSGRSGKAVFAEDDEEDADNDDDAVRSSGARYVFPRGCKGIDVQIDNSSRLRMIGTLRNMEISPRLPVHFPNRSDDNKYNHYNPSNSYPGPSHIYAQANMPSSSYVRPPLSSSSSSGSYGQPTKKPPSSYLPPANSSPRPIQNPPSTYLPPTESTKRPFPPINTYLPPNNPSPTTQRPSISQSSNNNQHNIITELVPPKEEFSCPIQNSECCDDSSGKLVIPIPLKNRNTNDCCFKTAKLVVPLTYFDSQAIEKLKEAFTKEEFDADNLIRDILGNMV